MNDSFITLGWEQYGKAVIQWYIGLTSWFHHTPEKMPEYHSIFCCVWFVTLELGRILGLIHFRRQPGTGLCSAIKAQ